MKQQSLDIGARLWIENQGYTRINTGYLKSDPQTCALIETTMTVHKTGHQRGQTVAKVILFVVRVFPNSFHEITPYPP